MASEILPWFEYKWTFDAPVGMFRVILTRLRGTPARLEEVFRGAPRERLVAKSDGQWSALEHAGHLWFLEKLWQTRTEEFLASRERLSPADLSNSETNAARFNERRLDEVLAGFRKARAESLARLDALTLDDAARQSLHPRLGVPMRLVDHCYFAAEHDDHHLAIVHSLLHGNGG
jgi:hypothetical protein